MVTELDHNAIMQRVIDIVTANSSFYDAITGGQTNKVRVMFLGTPAEPQVYPYAFISAEAEDDKPMEAVTINGSPAFMSQTVSEHFFNYNITIVVDRKRNEISEQNLNDLQKACKEALKSNVDLRKPSDGTDAKVKLSHPIRTRFKRGLTAGGKAVSGAIVTLQCQAFTS